MAKYKGYATVMRAMRRITLRFAQTFVRVMRVMRRITRKPCKTQGYAGYAASKPVPGKFCVENSQALSSVFFYFFIFVLLFLFFICFIFIF